jgi:hypothetical protein
MILLFMCFMRYASADQGLYSDTTGIYRTEELVDISSTPSALCQIDTSNALNAGSVDFIYLSLIGSFASSGPHRLGPYAQNHKNILETIALDKEIGALQSFFFQKSGSDGWILSLISCELQGVFYGTTIDLTNERWLDNYDLQVASDNEGNGYEPDSPGELFASPTMEILVTTVTRLFTTTGIPRS